MNTKQRLSESAEIVRYGQTYDFDDFSVVVRCFAVATCTQRFEFHLQACGRTAVIDLPADQRLIRDQIGQAVRAFASSIRLSRRS